MSLTTSTMITFKNYLVEAKFSEDDFHRILSTFEKRLPKLLGAKIYRSGGPSGVDKLGSGEVYQYFFDDRAFQIRAKGGHVYGIDVWDRFHIDQGPNYTIDVKDLNGPTLLGAISTLAKLIKNPSEGQTPVNQVTESVQLDEMAKRVDSDAFYKMVVKTFGAQAAKSVSWEQIKQVADENDVLIPAYIRGQKVGRGKWNAEPSSGGEAAPTADDAEKSTDKPEQKAGKKTPILYVKVTAQDPETKKFISAGASKEAQQLYAQIQDTLAAGPTEAEVKDPETLYGHMAQLVQMACKGSLRALLIYGGPGTGKTFTIMKTVNEMGMAKNKDYVKLSGKASPVEIYKTLFMYRDGGLVIFDDLDSMWRNEDATNILKAALDTSPVREISWQSNQTMNVSKMSEAMKKELFDKLDRQIAGEEVEDEPEDMGDDDGEEGEKKDKKKRAPAKIKFPSTFDFKGRVVFISNLKKEDFDSAILSRSAKINMDLTPEQILSRMRKILPKLGGDDVPLKQKEELLDHLLVMHKRKEIDAVTMREFTKGLDIVRSGTPNWKELLQYA